MLYFPLSKMKVGDSPSFSNNIKFHFFIFMVRSGVFSVLSGNSFEKKSWGNILIRSQES
jgi:hypothetical protein